MKYDVSWREDAYLLLVEIWDESSDADDLMRAIGEIDSALSEDADTTGESRSDGRRVFFAPPLGITFRVHFRLAEAVVVDVWKIQSRRS